MRIKKSIVKYVILISLFSVFAFQVNTLASEAIAVEKLDEIEEMLYGSVSSNSIVERVKNIEETIYGKKSNEPLTERVENIADYVLAKDQTTSLSFLLNTLEWSLINEINNGNIVDRLINLEKDIFGKSESAPLVSRISKLVNMSFDNGKVPGEEVLLKENQEIVLKLTDKIDSKTAQKGQIINYEVAESLVIDGNLVIPASTKGKLKITEVSEAGQFGKDAKVQFEFLPLRAIDGRKIEVKIPEVEFIEKRSRQLAVGSSILGAIVFESPYALVLGYFVKGQPYIYEAGSEISVVTADEYNIFSFEVD